MSRAPTAMQLRRCARRVETGQEQLLGIIRSILETQTTQHRQIAALNAAVRELQDIARAGGAGGLEGGR